MRFLFALVLVCLPLAAIADPSPPPEPALARAAMVSPGASAALPLLAPVPVALEPSALDVALNKLMVLALTGALALVGLLAQRATAYFAAHKEAIAAKTHGLVTADLLARAVDAALHAAQATEQSVIPTLNPNAPARDNAIAAKAAAVASFKSILGQSGVEALVAHAGAADPAAAKMIDTLIESAVHQVNAATSVTVASAAS